MKNVLFIISIILMTAFSVIGQTEKKVVIIKKIIDENGVKTVEEIVLEGDEAENFEMEDMDIDIQEDGENINVEVRKKIRIVEEDTEDIDGQRIRIIKKKGDHDEEDIEINIDNKNGNEDLRIIHLNDGEEGEQKKMIFIGEGEGLPEDIEEILEGHGIEWNDENGKKIIIKDLENESSTDPKAFLGVWPGEETDQGVTLGGVIDGSAAQKAGLKEGDIIRSFNGVKVATFSELSKEIKSYGPKDVVKIEFDRKGKSRTIDLELGENKSSPLSSGYYSIDKDEVENSCSKSKPRYFMKKNKTCCTSKMVEKAYIGIMIEDNGRGVKIVEVNREDDVLKNQDVITRFGKTDITNMDGLIDAVSKYEPGDRVKVKLVRDGKEEKTKVTLLGRMMRECCKSIDCCEDEKEENIEIIIQNGEERNIIKSDTGNARLELGDFNLYPNPNDGNFSLKFTSNEVGPVSITITDASGKEIMRDEISDFDGSYTGEFNLKGNTPGVYFVNISQNNKITTEKFILGSNDK